jgi:diguanylate cyclase (GGDEF)-like protein
MLIHAGYVLVMAGRILTWGLFMPDMNLFSPTMINVGYFLYDLLNNIALTIVFIMLNGQRLTSYLTVAQQALELLATKDSLTDLYNQRTLRELGQFELLRSRRMNHELALLMCDIDRFKHVNDTFGHAAGDKVLNLLGQQALRTCRAMDIVARMGGDEFVMLLPETSEENAIAVAERLRRTVAQEGCEWEGSQIKITLSIGVASLMPDDQEFESLLRRADDALYEAKRTGRDRLVAM